MRRNTIQREMVLRAVRSLGNHPTADEIYTYILKEHPSIGKGTVYRNLNLLVEENQIREVEVPNGPDRFDHNCSSHYHVQCINCNKVYDVQLEEQEDMIHKIKDTQGMLFLDYDILFRGVCPECQSTMKEVHQNNESQK